MTLKHLLLSSLSETRSEPLAEWRISAKLHWIHFYLEFTALLLALNIASDRRILLIAFIYICVIW